MSLAVRLSDLITAIGTDIKVLLQRTAPITAFTQKLFAGATADTSGVFKDHADGVYTYVLPVDGKFRVTLNDRVEHGGPYTYENTQWTIGGTATRLDNNGAVDTWMASGGQDGNRNEAHVLFFQGTAGQTITVRPRWRIAATTLSQHTFTFIASFEMITAAQGAKGDTGPTGTVGALTETGAVRWSRASDGALIAEQVVSTAAGANMPATWTGRAQASGTGAAEVLLEAKNGTPVSRLRAKNNPALSTNKRKVSVEVSDDSGTVIQIKDLLRSDGTSDYVLDIGQYMTDSSWVAMSMLNGCSNYGNGWPPMRYRYVGTRAIHVIGMASMASGLVSGSQVFGNLPGAPFSQMCPSWANGTGGAQTTRFDWNNTTGGIYLAQSSYGVNWHWFNSMLVAA